MSESKRQMTSCVHKMCGRTYGQTNMKRAITLAKINHPWNWYNMRMLRSWPIKIPNMNKMWPYVRSHILCTQLVVCLLSHFIHIWYLDWPWSEHAHIKPRYHIWIKSNKRLVTYTRFRDGRTDRRTRVFQYTHHSASGGINKLKLGLTWRMSLINFIAKCYIEYT
jgi:hypothetical protein